MATRNTAKVFWDRVAVAGEDDCWPWTRAIFIKTGYGQFWWESKLRGTHCVAYELHNGESVRGKRDEPGRKVFVCHSCDNRLCCNPKHLWLGNNTLNQVDASRKGRSAFGNRNGTHTHPERRRLGDEHPNRQNPQRLQRGSQRYNARFKEADIVAIRRRLIAGECQISIARSLGVTQSTIWAIAHRKSWRHVSLAK